MRNFRTFLITALLVFSFVTVVGFVQTQLVYGLDLDPQEKDVQLTDAQKKELETIQKDILNKRKEVISKYVKYGVVSEEKGKKIISRLEKHYEKLEQNDFVPKWDKTKKKKHSR